MWRRKKKRNADEVVVAAADNAGMTIVVVVVVVERHKTLVDEVEVVVERGEGAAVTAATWTDS